MPPPPASSAGLAAAGTTPSTTRRQKGHRGVLSGVASHTCGRRTATSAPIHSQHRCWSLMQPERSRNQGALAVRLAALQGSWGDVLSVDEHVTYVCAQDACSGVRTPRRQGAQNWWAQPRMATSSGASKQMSHSSPATLAADGALQHAHMHVQKLELWRVCLSLTAAYCCVCRLGAEAGAGGGCQQGGCDA